MNSRSDRPRPPAGRRPSNGFTLVELLIALAMVALIALLLFSGLRLGSRAWEAVDASAERTGALRLVNEFLVRTLSQTRPAQATLEAQPVSVFAGDEVRLELVAPLSENVGLPGLYILRLALEGAGERRNLVLTRWLMHPEILEGKDDIPPWTPLKEDSSMELDALPPDMDAAGGAFGRTLLLEDVEGLEISYFGIPIGELGASDQADWHKQWLDQSALPLLVRIHLISLNRSWPDLIVALPFQRP